MSQASVDQVRRIELSFYIVLIVSAEPTLKYFRIWSYPGTDRPRLIYSRFSQLTSAVSSLAL
jgi:hypothetical protein